MGIDNSTFPNQSRGQRLTTRGGGKGGRTSRRRVWPSPTTPEWSIAGPDVLGTEFYSISASKRRTNAVKLIKICLLSLLYKRGTNGKFVYYHLSEIN